MSSATNDLNVNLDPAAFALRPVRTSVRENKFRFYSAITFPNGSWNGCELYLRRCKAFGYLKDDGSNPVIDVLNQASDIIQELCITRAGFEYLRQQLKFVVEEG